MANLLSDPNLWISEPAGQTPPEYWDGTTYFITSPDYPDAIGKGMSLVDTAPSGSTLVGTATCTYNDFGTGNLAYFVVQVDGIDAIRQNIDGGAVIAVDLSITAGSAVSIFVDGGSGFNPEYTYSVLISLPVDTPTPYYVYELDKGWTFDGAYIPNFLELNWYFGDDPIHYHGIQKIRVHGLSKGRAYLTVAVNGMQTDYEPDYTEPQILDLPRNPKVISVDLAPETNYTDSASRGLSIQMKFEGRNTDIALPEPQHALQVLIVQSSPQGTGFRSN